MATARVPPGPRGNVVLGSIGDLYRDRLRFVLDVARTYGDVAQYRVAHMRMYQVNHPEGVGRLLHDNHRNYSKDVATFGTLRLILGNGLFTSDGEFLAAPTSSGAARLPPAARRRFRRLDDRCNPGDAATLATERGPRLVTRRGDGVHAPDAGGRHKGFVQHLCRT